jgi:hypothetical protein
MTLKIRGSALALAWVTGLVFSQDNVPVLETRFFPLKAGNTWQYKAGDQKVTVRVDKQELLDFKKGDKIEKIPAYRLVTTKDEREKSEHVAVFPDGVYRLASDGKEIQPPIRFFKLPLKKGESWEIEAVVEGMTVKGTFHANEEDVKVPAGTYKTMRITGSDMQIGSQKMNIEYWFSFDVGIVKQWVKLGSYEVVLELEKFTPGK